jgi:hypothetical protein
MRGIKLTIILKQKFPIGAMTSLPPLQAHMEVGTDYNQY